MTKFTGTCLKCDSVECEPTGFEYETEVVSVHLVCDDCGHEFDVVFDNGIIYDEEG